ncbi:hypothetical protein M427DRAFT_194938 [Gonapodya prolifera JEL478]|uniref:Uncharacterized protein n=1 Tax=Gonapodya prolifera (strain JEL478) TaxID=1344416 RepID=A0A139APC7_GONPJ|nr:hypothetical protein M427DRAFT_194938 [Gonapodya prolifera JEL478]|eukprot:KXS18578.1 hypothetical protein M427DRAFT_194938 [Gonapodya prolifera JEL478]
MRSAEALIDNQHFSPLHTNQHVDFLTHEFEGVQLVRTARSIRHLSDPSNPESVGIRLKVSGRKAHTRRREPSDTRNVDSNGHASAPVLPNEDGHRSPHSSTFQSDSDSESGNDPEDQCDLEDDPTRPDTSHRVVQTHETRKVRLQNVLWRLWAVKTLGLPGTDPRDLNWDKSADATSLYGPLPVLPPPIGEPELRSDAPYLLSNPPTLYPSNDAFVGAISSQCTEGTPRRRTESFSSRLFSTIAPLPSTYSSRSLSAFSDQYTTFARPAMVRSVLRVRPPQNALDVAAELRKLESLNEQYHAYHSLDHFGEIGNAKPVESQEAMSEALGGECHCSECTGDISFDQNEARICDPPPLLPFPMSVRDRVLVALGLKSLETTLTEMEELAAVNDYEREKSTASDTDDSMSDFGLTMTKLTEIRPSDHKGRSENKDSRRKGKSQRKRKVEFEKKVEQAVIVYPEEEDILEEEDEDGEVGIGNPSSRSRFPLLGDQQAPPRGDISDFFDKDYVGTYQKPGVAHRQRPRGASHHRGGIFRAQSHHQNHSHSILFGNYSLSSDELLETSSSGSTIGRDPSIDGVSDTNGSLKSHSRLSRSPHRSSGSSLTYVGSASVRTMSTASLSSTGTGSSYAESESTGTPRRRRKKPAGFRRIESGDLADPGVSAPELSGSRNRRSRRTDGDRRNTGRKDEEEQTAPKGYLGYVADVAGQGVGSALAYVGVDQGTIARGKEVLDNVKEMAGWLGVVAGFAGWI